MEDASINSTNNSSSKSAEELIRVVKDGDISAFDEIAKRYESAIRAIASTFNVPESDRDDLYQEGLIALYRAVCRYDTSVAKFSTFAGVCIKRAMITWIRDHSTRSGTDGVEGAESYRDESFENTFFDDTASAPDEIYISKETVKNLRSYAMKKLSDYEKCIFLMYLDEMNSSEISEAIGRSRKSVENALERIRKKLSSGK